MIDSCQTAAMSWFAQVIDSFKQTAVHVEELNVQTETLSAAGSLRNKKMGCATCFFNNRLRKSVFNRFHKDLATSC